jgi:biotin carboxyl carrier protein
MAYMVNVDGREFRVDVKKEDGHFCVTLNGEEMHVEIAHEQDSQLMLIVKDRPFAIVVESDSQILVNGVSYAVDVVDEQIKRMMKASPELEHKKEFAVKAVMPGLVIEVNVQEGDKVTGGEGLLVIEAMKMQNEIKAARDGVVKKIEVEQGQTVNTGDILLVIE